MTCHSPTTTNVLGGFSLETGSSDSRFEDGGCSASSREAEATLNLPRQQPDRTGAPILSRDPPERKATTRGLRNIGNTCYLNSSIQCLAHIPALREYFSGDHYQESLQVSGKSTEKTQGTLAKSFANLLKTLWSNSDDAVQPREFKDTFVTFYDMFRGHAQHDAVEFLEYCLDGVREDCNMVKGKKKYVQVKDSDGRPDSEVLSEVTNAYLRRSDSFFDDLMAGFTRASRICPKCGHTLSVTFEPFHSVKLPLEGHTTTFNVFILRCVSGAALSRHAISLPNNGNVADIISAVSLEAGLSGNYFLCKIAEGKILSILQSDDKITDIGSTDTLLLYEFSDASISNAITDTYWASAEKFHPGDLVIANTSFTSNSKKNRKIPATTHGLIHKIDEDGDALIKFDGVELRQYVFKRNLSQWLRRDLHMDSDEMRVSKEIGHACAFKEFVDACTADKKLNYEEMRNCWRDLPRPTETSVGDPDDCAVFVHFRRADGKLIGTPLILAVARATSAHALVEAVHEQIVRWLDFCVRDSCKVYRAKSFEDISTADAPLDDQVNGDTNEWLRKREYLVLDVESNPLSKIEAVFAELDQYAAQVEKTTGITLENCFDWYTAQEQIEGEDELPECPGCKQRVRSLRRIQFWSMPLVLMLQLNRFKFEGMVRKKVNSPVSFPLEGLDLSRYCLSQSLPFQSGACLRARQPVEIHGLQSEAGGKLNGRKGVAMHFNTESDRFCVRLEESDPSSEWKKLKSDNLRPIGSRSGDDRKANPPIYDLVAVCKHSGSASFGHYVAYARSSVDGAWSLYDDEHVSKVTPKEIESQREGAYSLFYVQRGFQDTRHCGTAP